MAIPEKYLEEPVVLLVDDEPGIRLILSTLLQEQGFRVVTAEDGQEALEYVRSIRPHVIVTDNMMPKLTGLQLISAVRKLPDQCDLPILLMSAVTPPEDALAAASVPFLSKPPKLRHLVRLLDQLINSSQAKNRY